MSKLVGKTFRILRRYDNGGYPTIRVVARTRRALMVLDYDSNGKPARDIPRPFYDEPGRPRLRKFWREVAHAD